MLRVGAVVVVAVALAGCGPQPTRLGTGRVRHGTSTTSPGAAATAATAPPFRVPGVATAAAVARTLTTAERAVRQPGMVSVSTPAIGQAQELGYGALTAHPRWRLGVLAAIPSDVRDAVTANMDAAVALQGLDGAGPPVRSLPTWTIRAPRPVAQLLVDYHEAETLTGVPWAVLAGIHLIESRLGRIQGPSGAGAQGPMQFLPATWSQYGQGGDINDDHDAIVAAARFLAARGGATNMSRALFAYNNDQRYVRAVQDYAHVMLAAPAAYNGYYQWRVYFRTARGIYLLPEGYPHRPAVRQGK